MEQVKTVQDIVNATKETGMPVKFEIDGVTYATYVENPPIEEQNKWAVYHAKKDQILLEANEKAQKEATILAFKNKARLEALKFAPTRKADHTNKISCELTADEISKEADVIYEWLIKGL